MKCEDCGTEWIAPVDGCPDPVCAKLANCRDKWMVALDLNAANRDRADAAEAELSALRERIGALCDEPLPNLETERGWVKVRDLRAALGSVPEPTD